MSLFEILGTVGAVLVLAVAVFEMRRLERAEIERIGKWGGSE